MRGPRALLRRLMGAESAPAVDEPSQVDVPTEGEGRLLPAEQSLGTQWIYKLPDAQRDMLVGLVDQIAEIVRQVDAEFELPDDEDSSLAVGARGIRGFYDDYARVTLHPDEKDPEYWRGVNKGDIAELVEKWIVLEEKVNEYKPGEDEAFRKRMGQRDDEGVLVDSELKQREARHSLGTLGGEDYRGLSEKLRKMDIARMPLQAPAKENFAKFDRGDALQMLDLLQRELEEMSDALRQNLGQLDGAGRPALVAFKREFKRDFFKKWEAEVREVGSEMFGRRKFSNDAELRKLFDEKAEAPLRELQSLLEPKGTVVDRRG